MQLERTGPYIPPVSFPGLGEIVLTSNAKSLLESSGLTGYALRPVDKKLIVELHWEKWDLNAPEPASYPDTGEPEGYVLGQPHSSEAAEQLGDVWEVVVPQTVRVLRPRPIVASSKELTIDSATWNGSDIFASSDVLHKFFTQRAKNWFLENFGEFADFEKFQVN
jgi:hypothetical protein